MPTDSDRLLAPGVPITFNDASTATLRYGMRSLKAMEDAYGSVHAAQEALSGLFTGANTRAISTLMPIMAAGLVHEGNKYTADSLLDLTDFGEIHVYLDAIGEALEQAFPAPKPGKAEGEASSPGTPSTESVQTSDAPTNSSGQ